MNHFTAWLTTEPACLDGDVADVTVLQNAENVDGEWINADAVSPSGNTQEPVSFLYTRVPAGDSFVQEARHDAEILLAESGWRMTGDWVPYVNGAFVDVERAQPWHVEHVAVRVTFGDMFALAKSLAGQVACPVLAS